MDVVVRILSVSFLTGAATAGLGCVVIASAFDSPPNMLVIPALAFGCIGGVIGAVAGAAREIVSAQRGKPPAWPEIK